MATPTYELIETTTLTSSASSVSFSSITQDYRDLVLVVEAENPGNGAGLEFNADTTSDFVIVEMDGQSGSPGSFSFTYTGTAFFSPQLQDGALHIFQIMDYSATDKHKSLLHRGNKGANPSNPGSEQVVATAARWANTAAITSIKVASATFNAGATFSLYGIA